MNDPRRRAELTTLVERHRRELGERPDVSQRMRKLSQSSSRNAIGKPRPQRATLTLLFGALAVMVMVACVASAALIFAGGLVFQGQLSDPTTTTQKFYSALHEENYTLAYSYFSKNLKSHISEGAFADTYSSYDRIDGVIESYPIQSQNVGSATATLTIAVERRGNDSQAQTQTLRLVKEGSDWHIESIILGAQTPIPSPTN